MRFSWNEIRARAARFAEEWADATYEKGETQPFYDAFFDVFGIRRRKVAVFEKQVQSLKNTTGFIDLFWKGKLLVEQKSAGRDLEAARQQALDYCEGLSEDELPRYILTSDFRSFELFDLEERTETRFALSQLPQYIRHFDFMLGVERREFKDQDPVNIRASELVGRLHDALLASGYKGHDLEQFLVRIVFCLFADDTGIFKQEAFLDLIRERTHKDGSDVGSRLSQLFEVLNTPESERHKNLDEDFNAFPYVDGHLFEERLSIPSFDFGMRTILLDACEFDWGGISPAIFGALFQSVMDRGERRAQGAHYTTEANILKVIQPLFLDRLRSEFLAIKRKKSIFRHKDLLAFHQKLGTLQFFDPACGCGNFLIISYRELRLLEIDVLREVHPEDAPYLDIDKLSAIDVDQFHGIELLEFPARIAETALWMMDHIMNLRLSEAFGNYFARIPLRKAPHIVNKDALETDWNKVLPADRCYAVMGNPPFSGSKYQSPLQREQIRRIADLGGSGGTLDYVCAWFIKAGEYIQGHDIPIGFVATNSITQGEQVAQIWPILFQRHALELQFAHRTFAWGSDARGMAHVHVVILGLVNRKHLKGQRRLFSYDDLKGTPVETKHYALSPYLFDASRLHDKHLVIRERSAPLQNQPKLISGSQPIDNGNYIFEEAEKRSFLREEPNARRFLRPYVGGDDYLNGIRRWLLCLQDASPKELRSMPHVRERMNAVRKFRLDSKRKSTLAIAEMPEKLNVEVFPKRPFLVIPEVSSERRDYVPIGWLKPPTVPSNLVRVLLDADLWHFGILTSRMHMAWLRFIGGRLESRYRYSIGIVYNCFPWPEATTKQKDNVRKLAQAVLDARAEFAGSTLAELYDHETMKPVLRKAHQRLDAAVEKLYQSKAFQSDRERVELLFQRYEDLLAQQMALPFSKGD